MNFCDLPVDIIFSVTEHLSPSALLSFCATCRQFHENRNLRFSCWYWSQALRKTFLFDNVPVSSDGYSNFLLFKQLATNSHLYGWGLNDKGALGGDLFTTRTNLAEFHRIFPPSRLWPKPLQIRPTVPISDIQCTGWSTVYLDTHGSLNGLGVIDGREGGFGDHSSIATPFVDPQRLHFPPGFHGLPSNPHTSIEQFSTGQCHVLGISENGTIWSWDDINRPGVHVDFISFDLVVGKSQKEKKLKGTVRKVVAGWNRSSAYINGFGIVLWEPSNNAEIQGQADRAFGDGMLVLEQWTVPYTGFVQSDPGRIEDQASSQDPARGIGKVTNWIILTQFVVFVTKAGNLYAWQIPILEEVAPMPICLTVGHPSAEDVLDIQGKHQNFGIFRRNGDVLIGTEEYLLYRWEKEKNGYLESNARLPDSLKKIPALQDSGVKTLAFGDQHFHALHSDGNISSYGGEQKYCGSMGLGAQPVAQERGLRDVELTPGLQGRLSEDSLTMGRRVHFEFDKADWLYKLRIGDYDERRGMSRTISMTDDARRIIGNWLEYRLSKWNEERPNGEKLEQDEIPDSSSDVSLGARNDLPPYYAVAIAAAGHHSVAIMLVNKDKRDRVQGKHYSGKPSLYADNMLAPRLRLPDGNILPGEGEIIELPPVVKFRKAVESVFL